MQQNILSKDFQEFLLSFNTTICVGMTLLICIIMRNHNNIIKQEVIDKIGDTTIKFIPKIVINLIDAMVGNRTKLEPTEECPV